MMSFSAAAMLLVAGCTGPAGSSQPAGETHRAPRGKATVTIHVQDMADRLKLD